MNPKAPREPEAQVTHDQLLRLLSYDPATGAFTWRRVQAGDTAGWRGASGYWIVRVDGLAYQAHRLAWFYTNGAWPPYEVDHIDGKKTNNRLANLRPASRAQNARNAVSQRRSKSGVRGVYPCAVTGLWLSQVTVGGIRHYVGRFADIAEATAARNAAAVRLHEEFARMS
jgi:hypothetical protein